MVTTKLIHNNVVYNVGMITRPFIWKQLSQWR